MDLLKKLLIYSVCIVFLSIQCAGQVMAGYYAQNNSGAGITEKAPQVLSTPPQEIPFAEGKKETGDKTLLYVAGGGVALIAIVAVALGGGGGGGGGDDPVPNSDPGSVDFSW